MPEVKKETAPAPTEAASGAVSASRTGGFSLAHLSDLHLTTLQDASFSQMLSKRMLGYSSWRRKRRIVHRRDIVDAMLADLRITAPDHIAVTGDLTHIGLPGEFAEAARWLPSLGTPQRVTVIPGNHEAYAGTSWIRNCAAWDPYLQSDPPQAEPGSVELFPSFRVRGPLALIGLCSARPSLPLLAVGSLGKVQLDSFADLLRSTGEAGLMRVVLIHHPPVPGTVAWRKRLVDSQSFCDTLARHGAELVLHGHAHTPTFTEIATPAGRIPVVGAPSASEWNPRAARRAQYNVFAVEKAGLSWRVKLSVREYSEASGQFVAGRETVLLTPGR